MGQASICECIFICYLMFFVCTDLVLYMTSAFVGERHDFTSLSFHSFLSSLSSSCIVILMHCFV